MKVSSRINGKNPTKMKCIGIGKCAIDDIFFVFPHFARIKSHSSKSTPTTTTTTTTTTTGSGGRGGQLTKKELEAFYQHIFNAASVIVSSNRASGSSVFLGIGSFAALSRVLSTLSLTTENRSLYRVNLSSDDLEEIGQMSRMEHLKVRQQQTDRHWSEPVWGRTPTGGAIWGQDESNLSFLRGSSQRSTPNM